MTIKKLKRIVPITLGAVTATALAVSLPLALTSCNSSSDATEPVVKPPVIQDGNQTPTLPEEESGSVESGESNVTTDDSTITEDNKQDPNVDDEFSQHFGDEIETKLLGSLINTNKSNKVVFGNEVSFILLPKLKGEFNKYTYSWKVTDLSNNNVVYSANNSTSSDLNLNQDVLKHAGQFKVEGQISQVNTQGQTLTSEQYSQVVSVYPSVKVSLPESINFKNNQVDALIQPEISFEGINKNDFNKAKSLYSFAWTKDGQSLSNNLFATRNNDNALNIKLATDSLAGNYQFTAKLNDKDIESSSTASTKVSIDAASFHINVEGNKNVQIGDNVNLTANVQSNTRSTTTYSYRWYVKNNDAKEAQEISNSNSSTYTLNAVSREDDNGSKYYVVAKDNSTGEVQWSNIPHAFTVESAIKGDLKIVNQDSNSNELKVGESTTITFSDFNKNYKTENVNLDYEWLVSENGEWWTSLNDNSNPFSQNYSFQKLENGLKITSTSSNTSNQIFVKLKVNFIGENDKWLDSVISSNEIKLTKVVNDIKYAVNLEEGISKIKEAAQKVNNSNAEEVWNKGYISSSNDIAPIFNLNDKAKWDALSALGLSEPKDSKVDVTLERVNNASGKMSFDMHLELKNPNYKWSLKNSLSKVDSNYSISGQTLTLKGIDTNITPLFNVENANSVEKQNNKYSMSIKVTPTASKNDDTNDFKGFLKTVWYFKDKDGKFKEVNEANGFTGVNITSSSDAEQTKGTYKLINDKLEFDNYSKSEDLSDLEFYGVVSFLPQYDNNGLINMYDFITEWNQTPIKLSINK